jgi:glycosyltransferase involved in cell wall biosynthesis
MSLVTFLVPVFNAQNYIREALESIQKQTYTDFKVLIINDGSTDRSLQIIEEFTKTDQRFQVISRENKGLVTTLNEGIELIDTKYIARMDADDICHKQRLEQQIKHMEESPEVGVSGSYITTFGTENSCIGYPTSNQELKSFMLFTTPFSHPTVIIRKDVLSKSGIRYDENYQDCEDYKLWIDLAEVTEFSNLPLQLLFYRKHGNSVSDNSKLQKQAMDKIKMILLNKLQLPDVFVDFHINFSSGQFQKLQYEYWPTYLNEFKNLGGSFFHTAILRFRSFCKFSLPEAEGKQFYNCVCQAIDLKVAV